ncbi:tripartite tricarboxylate transporter TctB family protein [bacterium D16-54]|nr:tripartite tricarboxylate transporter TctB family protein [bacterium D16-54]RKJ15919.1 tripartite tricarboxylate transporter TctB family protein [bacterium D16-56]
MDIIFSVILAVFCIYCFFLVGAESPAATPTELGAAFWPRIILVMMIILLAVNIVNNLRAQKENKSSIMGELNLGEFLKSRLLVGIILVAVMALLMSAIGFMPDCLLFLIAYGFLLGERRIPLLVIRSLAITVVLYVIFQGALDIMLARGVGPFREFALFFEMLLPF